jgi:hypothetical protein
MKKKPINAPLALPLRHELAAALHWAGGISMSYGKSAPSNQRSVALPALNVTLRKAWRVSQLAVFEMS